MMILIAILLGLCAGAAIFFLIDHFSTRKLPTQQFKREQAKALQGLVEKKNAVEKEFNEDIERRHNERKQQLEQEFKRKEQEIDSKVTNLTNQLNGFNQFYEERKAEVEREYNEKVTQLKDSYASSEKEIQEKVARAAQDRQSKLEKEVEEEQRKLNLQFNKLQEDYKEKKEELEHDFFVVSEQISTKKEALTVELQSYQEKQSAIIARFKADEEKKNNLDFYRMKLSEAEIEDIKKLKSIADSLHYPTVLYKLIWENYYKSKFSELIGRIAPAKAGCGIYKITNIENGKVYIGQTRQSFNDRLRSHVRKGLKAEPTTNNKLYAAMWEYGPENFTFEVVTQCKAEELNEKEKYFIEFYQSIEWGYNTQSGVKKS